MPLSTDISAQLINIALLAIIALPFVVIGCTLYLKEKLGRPAWATYRHIRDLAAQQSVKRDATPVQASPQQPASAKQDAVLESPAPQENPQEKPSEVRMSAFGR